MKTEILSNEYVDGMRVSTQKVTYSKCDDLHTLSQYYGKLAEALYLMENPNPDTNVNQLSQEQLNLERLVNAQKIIVDGYEGGV